jgi:LmbE family N-acetylglucosaminyl deacetylase
VLTLTADRPLHVLCVGAHPDDIEIGCGGTLLTLAARGTTRFTALVLTGGDVREKESRLALDELAPGVTAHFAHLEDARLPAQWRETKEALEHLAGECRPDLVLAPRTDDAHQDHALTGQLVTTVWRDSLVLHYEIPKWDGDLGAPNTFVPLPAEVARRKVDVLNDCFGSQTDRDWWDDETFFGLMRLRGVECRSRYAEAFFSSKVVLGLGPDP